jgi:hypothetical protein
LGFGTAGSSSEHEAQADDESEDEPEDDIDRPLNAFERAQPELLKFFKRLSSIFTGPEAVVDPSDKGKPSEFFRVCDEKAFVTFNDDGGFFNRSFVELPGWFFIDATSVAGHINWAQEPTRPSVSRYISMCSTTFKRSNERVAR